jgi:ABC-type sugar transport system permease subunit/outer membrane protein assembly factor BamB
MPGLPRLRHITLSLIFIACAVIFSIPALAQSGQWEQQIGDVVYSTALSADGSLQLVGSRDNRAAAYDAQGNLLWEFKPGGTVWGVSTSEDGQITAVASEDRNVYLLNDQGEQVWAFRSSRIVLDVAVSADGSRIFASDEGRTVYFLDSATGEPLWQASLQNIADRIAIYGTKTIRVVAGNRDSQVMLFGPDGKQLWITQLADSVLSVDVNSNGKYIVAGTLDGKVTLINGANGDTLWRIDLPNEVACNTRDKSNCVNVAINADGSRIIVGTLNGDVYLLDGAEGDTLQEQTAAAPITSVSISQDGQTLMFATREGVVNSINTAVAAAEFAAAQERQRNLTIGIPIAILLIAVVFSVWVQRTNTGRNFWAINMRRPRELVRQAWRSRISYILIAPTIILLLIFNYYPAFSGLYHSFTEWTPGIGEKWVGLSQFQAVLNSQYFWIGIQNALILAASAFIKLCVPLLVAELIFHIRSGALQYAIRTMFIVPLVVPGVVGILLWVNIYDPNIGLLNQTLRLIGLDNLTRAWLGDKTTALPAIIAIGLPWVSPFALLIFYGGLISIPQELFDAAKVDGATWWTRFWRIDLPLLMSQIKLLIILAFIGSVQEFQSIFLTTGGGPGSVTYTPALELYYQATRFNNYGLASAMGTVLFIVILGGTIINLRYVRSQTEYEA